MKLKSNHKRAMYEGRASGEEYIKLSVYSPPNLSRPTFKEATSKTFKETKVGDAFGPSWSTHWFKIELKVPSNLLKKDLLELHWDADNEGLVWTEDGEPIQGLTGGGERVEWILPKYFRDGKFHTFYIEMACNKMFGNAPGGDSIQPPDPNKFFNLHQVEILAINKEARALFVDFWIIGGKVSNPCLPQILLKFLFRCCERVSMGLMGISSGLANRKCHHGCIYCRARKPSIHREGTRDCPKIYWRRQLVKGI